MTKKHPNRRYRGSGCVGRIPMTKPGNPYKERRKTKPLCKGKHTTPEYHEAVMRGQRKMYALAFAGYRINKFRQAVRSVLRRN